MYEQYLRDPSTVDEAWHDFFADYRPNTAPATTAAPANAAAGGRGNGSAPAAPAPRASAAAGGGGRGGAAGAPAADARVVPPATPQVQEAANGAPADSP